MSPHEGVIANMSPHEGVIANMSPHEGSLMQSTEGVGMVGEEERRLWEEMRWLEGRNDCYSPQWSRCLGDSGEGAYVVDLALEQ